MSPVRVLLAANEIFVGVFDATAGKGFVFRLQEADLDNSNFRRLFQNPHSGLKSPVSRCEVKIVGPSALVALAASRFRDIGANPAVRDRVGAEVLYDVATGRVRVSIDQKVEPDSTIQNQKIRVLIVDDSKTIQKVLSGIMGEDPSIEVVAIASRPSEVESLILKHKPDVMTLDLHMPEMDGTTLLKRIMPKYPIPTIIITSESKEESSKVLEALESGALDYIQKPSFSEMKEASSKILEKIKVAARAKVKLRANKERSRLRALTAPFHRDVMIAIGSSTGGTEALKDVLLNLPDKIPPVMIVQHIPPVFSAAFASRLNQLCPFEVKEAEDGDEVIPNRVLIAPGGKQMEFVTKNGRRTVRVFDGPPVNRHRPSVDVLFDSLVGIDSRNTIGVILTGMGNDGAKGMLALHQAGARTIAQDEESCVVFGMPKEAIKLGGVSQVDSLDDIPLTISQWMRTNK